MSTREVTLDGGSPWGFRMHGGADLQQPLRIARVNPGSKAAQRGIREGDLISSINGQPTRTLSNAEAHSFLRNAGETLTLGLNQEVTGSPKRRAQKIAQESKEDALKRTSITSTVSTTTSTSTITRVITNTQNNEISNTNGANIHRNSEETGSYTPYIKNGTPLTAPRGDDSNGNNGGSRGASVDDDTEACLDHREETVTDLTESALVVSTIMPDNAGSSRSRKQRRARANRKKSNKKCGAVRQTEPSCSEVQVSVHVTQETGDDKSTEALTFSECVTETYYRVDSPAPPETKPQKSAGMIKSRSLDDDDHLKITEITGEDKTGAMSESRAIVREPKEVQWDTVENKSGTKSENRAVILEPTKIIEISGEEKTPVMTSESQAVVLEPKDVQWETGEEKLEMASESRAIFPEPSDVQWETVADLEIHQRSEHRGKLSIISLPLEEYRTFDPCHISPEDEKSLRDFLESLNLVKSAEESARRIEKGQPETAKFRKAKKRAALVQHFLPYYQNPRYLDVISEEGSDLSDKDNQKTRVFKHRPIEPSLNVNLDIDYLDEEDDVFEEDSTMEKKLRNKFQTYFATSHGDAILVGTKLIDTDFMKADHVDAIKATWSTSTVESRSGAEVVYLEDSSNSVTPSDFLDQDETVDADDEEDISIDLDKLSESLDVEVSSGSSSLIKSDSAGVSSGDTLRDFSQSTTVSSNSDQINQLSPVYTPCVISANDTEESPPLNEVIDFSGRRAQTPSERKNDDTGARPESVSRPARSVDDGVGPEPDFGDSENTDKKNSDCQNCTDAPSESMSRPERNVDNGVEPGVDLSDLRKNENIWGKIADSKNDSNDTPSAENVSLSAKYTKPVTDPSDLGDNENPEEKISANKNSSPVENASKFERTADEKVDPVAVPSDLRENENLPNVKNTEEIIDSLQSNVALQRMLDEVQALDESVIEEEESEKLNKELRDLCDRLNRPEDEYSSRVDNSASRSGSANSARSSSQSTSQCTAFYNPGHSSLTNIAAMLREGSDDAAMSDQTESEPLSLKGMCVRALLALPFGKDVMEELATVSLSIEEMTCRTPLQIPPHPPRTHSESPHSAASDNKSSQPATDNKTDTDTASCALLVGSPVIRTSGTEAMSAVPERWVGLPTDENPNLLVCLSPAQKQLIDRTKACPNEADSLLDLHRKYIERRGYHEDHDLPHPPSLKDIPTFRIKIDPRRHSNTHVKIPQNGSGSFNSQQSMSYGDYVKQFTWEIPTHAPKPSENDTHVKNGNIRYDKYIKQLTREVPIQVEKQINKPVNNKIYSGAIPEPSSSRTNAQTLAEWLNLARNECNNLQERIRTYNSSVPGKKIVSQRSFEERPASSAGSAPKRSTSPRRYSLPFNLYEQQMQYILEKEKEIQKEIEKLQEEKSRLERDADTLLETRAELLQGPITSSDTEALKYPKFPSDTEPLKGSKLFSDSESLKDSKLLSDSEALKGPSASSDTETLKGPKLFSNTEALKDLKLFLDTETFKGSKPLVDAETVEHIIETHVVESKPKEFDAAQYQISRKGDIAILQAEAEKAGKPVAPSTEKFREEMYNEYMSKVAERHERKQNKVIKIKISPRSSFKGPTEEPQSPQYEVKHVSGIEDEFMTKVRQRMDKLGLASDKSDEDLKMEEESEEEEPVFVVDGDAVATGSLPKHLQEFIDFTKTPPVDEGVWSPGKGSEVKGEPGKRVSPPKEAKSDEPAPVVWTPRSAGSSPTADRKEFRPVSFESPVLARKNKSTESTSVATPDLSAVVPPPWQGGTGGPETTQEAVSTLSTSLERRLTTSHSAPAAGLNNLSKLPRAQNPTITLLQKAREGQLPRGALYIEDTQQTSQKPKTKDDRPPLLGPNEILYKVKSEYMSESDSENPKKMADLGSRKFDGIGPTTKDGMPIVLRSIYDQHHQHHQEVKDSDQAKWYKRMYDTLHRSRNDDEYVTVRYKTRRGRYPYTSAGGYLSEPEPNAYDSDLNVSASKYATLDRRRLQTNRDKENEYIAYTIPRHKYMPASVKHSTDVYKNQPGRIENYVPGHSSISEKEAKEWWDEVMEIFDGWLDDHSALPSLNYMLSQVTARSHLEQQKHVPASKSYMSQALKESGYESDSTLVFRRREDAALQFNPHEQKEAYKNIQRGGEVPLHGLRKPAPERPKDDSEIEYFPISPTLTRIRIHKNVKPVNEILCYPITVQRQPSPAVFSTYKRSAPSQAPPPKLPRPPSPPKRRSSRNSHTLRLISTMTIHHSPKSTRHETCFKSSDRSNVKFLRDRISCKLKSTPGAAKKTIRVTKTISTFPSTSKESLSSRDSKGTLARPKGKTAEICKREKPEQHYSRSTAASAARRCCRHCSFSVPPKLSDSTTKLAPKHRALSLERTFGSEKRKVDLTLPKTSRDISPRTPRDISPRLKLVKSPDLISPTEVKKGVQSQQKQKDLLLREQKHYPPGTINSPLEAKKWVHSQQKNYPPGTIISSPTEAKKWVQSQQKLRDLQLEKHYPPGTIVKKSTSLLSSARNGLKSPLKPEEKSLNVTVAMTERGKELLNSSLSSRSQQSRAAKSPSPLLSRVRSVSNSPVPSSISDRSKSSIKSRALSVESLHSPPMKKKNLLARPSSMARLKLGASSKDDLSDKRRSKKVKKDQSNEELKQKKKLKDNKTKDTEKSKPKKCAGRAAGSEIVKKLKKMEELDSAPRGMTSGITPGNIAERHKDIMHSDSFFQHLFLRDILTSPTPSVLSRNSYVFERAKMLENGPSFSPEPTVNALKVYLSHRKPVSESKFKTMDRELVRSRSESPYRLMRSFSERVRKFDSISEVSNEDSLEKGSISPESIRSRRSSSLPATKIVFTEISRPVSPVVDKSVVIYGERKKSPSPIRSPSRRKIHSIKPPASITVEGISGLKKKVRARSAGEAESLRRELYSEKSLTPSVSSASLTQIADPHEYKAYVTELRHSAKKGERFKELNQFYSSLERLGQLERTTSSSDLRPRRRNEDEIIDYDRWMQVRRRERAEMEFSSLYRKLKQDQREKDLVFRTKDVDNFRWKHDRDFGLKIKEHSVENIKEQFERLKVEESPLEVSRRRILDYQKDVYKPLWRGNSVLNLVSRIAEKRSQSESRVLATRKKLLCAERLLSREIGSKLWSSLSVEQVNALKNQLVEIYSHSPQQQKRDDFSINVEPRARKPDKQLVIRRNSANELSKPLEKKVDQQVKSSSIGAICGGPSFSETDKKRLSLSLSREAQDRMSQKCKYKTSLSIVLGKETRGAIAAAEAQIKLPESTSPRTCYSLEPTEDDVGKAKTEKDFVLVLTKDESEEEKQSVRQTLEEWSQVKSDKTVPKAATPKEDKSSRMHSATASKSDSPSTASPKRISSTSESAESAGSDTSTKTTIFVGKKEDLHKKIEYFERGADADSYIPTVYRPAEPTDEEYIDVTDVVPVKETQKDQKANLAPSQSYADLKELFGEKELMKFATVPLSASRKQGYPSRPLLRATNISPIRTLSEGSSTESLFRSRSVSPSEKFWSAYFALLRGGVDVRKLTEKFESMKDFHKLSSLENFYDQSGRPSQRRCRSDPDLAQKPGEFGEVYWLKQKYEGMSRGRSRTRRGKLSPVPKVPLKAEDRLMPHINIISKLASLYPKKTSSERKSMEDLAQDLGCPVGEVEKLREKFESPDRNLSLLGQMYTSSPNLHELRDISSYLTGSWIAHQYPRYQDNALVDLNGDTRTSMRNLLRRGRPKSASPPRSKPSSILKQQVKDIFANQYYDPRIHRPTYRYQPTSPGVERGRTRSWSPSAKHSVTFKEPVLGPTPPPKGVHVNKYFGPESPRKYVEDEVTIHYRSPVRHEIKEALSEEELARRQAEAMRRIYQEERRRKYLQELQDMNSRRHTDNFIPSQKSPIPLNRYDDFIDDLSMKTKVRDRSPEPRLVARALYNFVGQSSRELTFRKGDVIFIRRQVDKNWYEGEHNAMFGLFPANYVEIVPYDGIKSTPRKAHEGQARARFNFIAQTHLELSLAKGELVVLTRRVDDNWYEGRIGTRKGIFPRSYVEVLIDPGEKQETIITSSSKPVASPAAHSMLLNGSAGGKESMGSHHYQPPYTPHHTTTSYHAKPVNVIGTSSSYTSLTKTQKVVTTPSVSEALHIDTQQEPVPYRALYKYRPQNDDELELQEGDTVYVLEKCDDGWYVGSSQRTGAFGTFPGNYVERI